MAGCFSVELIDVEDDPHNRKPIETRFHRVAKSINPCHVLPIVWTQDHLWGLSGKPSIEDGIPCSPMISKLTTIYRRPSPIWSATRTVNYSTANSPKTFTYLDMMCIVEEMRLNGNFTIMGSVHPTTLPTPLNSKVAI